MGQGIRVITLAVLSLLIGNRQSLAEGLRYLWQMVVSRPDANQRIDPAGAFGLCYELVQQDNATRYQTIAGALRNIGLEPEIIPVPDEPLPNLLVRFHQDGPYTVFIAHYDLSRETPTYQGASDNTASVCVLLAAARDLVAQPPSHPVALLFTAAEERGLKGARAFLEWSKTQRITIAEVINLDMLGRDRLATRPSALPGFYFWLPGIGDLVYDGRRLRRGTAYALPERRLVQRLKQFLVEDLIIYRCFTVYSDSNVFQEAGIPTVSISSDNMYYLDLVWDRDADRAEWLDERNLELARRLVGSYARYDAIRS
jgi:hypothetical protein